MNNSLDSVKFTLIWEFFNKVYTHMQVDVFKSLLLQSGILYCNSGISGAWNVTVPSHPGVIVISNILGNLAAVMYVRSSEPNTKNDLLAVNLSLRNLECSS
jgi:hypothetical protein